MSWGKIYESTNWGEGAPRSMYNSGTPDGFQISAMYELLRIIGTDDATQERIGCQFDAVFELQDIADTSTGVGPNAPVTWTGLLDTYTGAAAAYSTRKLKTGATNSVRVRRSSDDTEQDIGFDANGDLDATALTTFVNAEHTIADEDFSTDPADNGWVYSTGATWSADVLPFVNSSSSSAAYKNFGLFDRVGLKIRVSFTISNYSGSGEIRFIKHGASFTETGNSGGTPRSANGIYTEELTFSGSSVGNVNWGLWTSSNFTGEIDDFEIVQITADGAVTKWYDQSGNSNDAINADASEQPLVVSGGALVTENGKAAIEFDGVDDYLQNTSLVSSTPTTHYLTAKANSTGTTQRFTDGGVSSSTRHSIYQNAARFQYFGGVNFTGDLEDTNQNLHYFLTNGTSSEIGVNGATASVGNAGTNTLNGLTFASRWDGGAQWGSNSIQELIIFDSDQSGSREGIETNINEYFDIYTP